jgi:hypothetical protein
VSVPRLYLNHIANLDWLVALEFGRVDDAQPAENWRGVSATFGFLHEAPDGPIVGFKIVEFSKFDPDNPEVAEIWEGPRFDAPVLGLRGVAAGEIVRAARALFGEQSSVNRRFFSAAIGADGEKALGLWLACLQAGDPMGHYGLGYTLCNLGRFPEAYRHLRHYTEIAPRGSWNWCWLGKAAEAIGATAEARAAYERALELEPEGGEETDARERLDRLDSPDTGGTDRADHLDALLEAAGHEAIAGYRVGEGLVAWIIAGARHLVLAEESGRAWLFAEVGIQGFGVYPEDDLAEEATIELPQGYLLWWDDNAERAVLAHDLGESISAVLLSRALSAFGPLADDVERRLTSIEELCIAASPPGGDLLARGPFVPPAPLS